MDVDDHLTYADDRDSGLRGGGLEDPCADQVVALAHADHERWALFGGQAGDPDSSSLRERLPLVLGAGTLGAADGGGRQGSEAVLGGP